MHKRNTTIILILFAILGITSCNKAGNKLIDSSHMVTPTAGNIVEPTVSATIEPTGENIAKKNTNINNQNSNANELNSSNYKIQELNYTQNDDKIKYNINYPEISGLSDNEKQKKVNSTLKNEALKVLKYYEKSEGAIDITINYNIIFKNANILSIQYSGTGFVTGAAHPNSLFYTTSINIRTGNRLRLSDVVNIDEDFVNKFLNGGFKSLLPEKSEALRHFTNEKIKKYFNEADSLDNIGTEKQTDVFSYFTNDSLGISISVGHAMGDHAEFEIKYQDLKDNIKAENEIWKDLLHLSSEENNNK